MKLQGKTAIITGGSRGIGKAIALKFASEGANIAIICAANIEMANSVCQSATEYGVKAMAFKCDVADSNEVTKVVNTIINQFGSVDILVNSAGVIRDNLLISISDEDYDAVMDTSLKGTFNMIRACYYQFIRKKSGKIINLSSTTGLNGNVGQANYSAAKAGIVGLTKSVARELAQRGICCNAIAPGVIETEMTQEVRKKENAMDSIPMKRYGTVDDVANCALFLATSESDYITGEVIRVDGGLAI